MAETSQHKQPRRGPGKRFTKGQSGNPRGKAPGTRNRITMLAEKLMEDDAEAIVRAIVEKAKAGDMTAGRMVLERIAPLRKSQPVAFKLPKIETAQDVQKALGALVELVGKGELCPDEGSTIAGMIETQRRSIEILQLERRIADLEAKEQDGK